MRVDIEKIEIMEPMTWLIGRWSGKGSGVYPTIAPFNFHHQMIFKSIDESYADEPLIHYEEVGWIIEEDNKVFKHWETGFIKPTEDGRIQFYNSHNTGRTEVTYGKYLNLDTSSKSFEIEFESDFLRNDIGIKKAIKSIRKFAFQGNKLSYSLAMSTAEVSGLSSHLEVQLSRTET